MNWSQPTHFCEFAMVLHSVVYPDSSFFQPQPCFAPLPEMPKSSEAAVPIERRRLTGEKVFRHRLATRLSCHKEFLEENS